jgi:acyl dehydratase
VSGRYLEDFEVGEVIESVGSYEVTAENIVAFATEFDPQPIHLDEDAAVRGFFGEMTASGWQTLSATMGLLVRSPLFASGEVIGVGVDKVRWLVPVRPGDRLRARAQVLTKRASRSRPDRGLMTLVVTTLRGDELVASQECTVLVPRRPLAPRADGATQRREDAPG